MVWHVHTTHMCNAKLFEFTLNKLTSVTTTCSQVIDGHDLVGRKTGDTGVTLTRYTFPGVSYILHNKMPRRFKHCVKAYSYENINEHIFLYLLCDFGQISVTVFYRLFSMLFNISIRCLSSICKLASSSGSSLFT